ncbi:DUF4393 domain-containing protein [Antrihabitans cavernicola]|uniref:DUF4393 domain-containing protein n=1 Tax=Antrihabitans cavernicola TaxID=2495913 RepID=A0A5A7SEI7_9NOCA|nr:DUF4393 domain-containing protein [Spelaeibacter cavernicola]KAA0023829.1 DUF4393 domain-containing protein [Spelaeibacter cavernicola]
MASEIARSGNNEVTRTGANLPAQISPEARILRGVFRVAGLAAGTAIRGGTWAAGTTIDAGRQVVAAAMEGDSPEDVAERASARLRSLARTTLGVTEESVREIVSYVPTGNLQSGNDATPTLTSRESSAEELRRRGDELLATSANVYSEDAMHPAYGRILGELAPDEARMLRFLALNGNQPIVDVRTNRPLGIGSELIESDLSSVSEQAGCRHPERSRSYLINLKRLGLLAIADEPVELSRYMVLEVQPKVDAAVKRAGRAPKIVRKRVALTDFGVDFCRTCFTLESSNATGIGI